MAKRCTCQAYLRPDGACPLGCQRELAAPAWRRARLAAKMRNREAEESRVRYLSRDESTRGVLRADPTYRRDFFERSVRVRARSSRRRDPS